MVKDLDAAFKIAHIDDSEAKAPKIPSKAHRVA